jgi:signal transduction histidine kinase
MEMESKLGRLLALPKSDFKALLSNNQFLSAHIIENLVRRLEQKERELYEALQQRVAISEILRAISNSPTDAQSVLDIVAEAAAQLCDVTDAEIMQVEGDELRLVAKHGLSQQWPIGTARPINRDWVTGRAVVDCTPVHVHDLQKTEAEFPLGAVFAKQYGHRTTFATPLLREGVAVGAILIRRMEVRPLADNQIALLKTFADQAVIAIENARLFRELQARTVELAGTNTELRVALEQQTAASEILRVISSSPTDIQPVFDAIARSALRLCDGAFSVVTRFDGDLIHLSAHASASAEAVEALQQLFPTPPTRMHATGRAILEGKIIHLPDVSADADYDPSLRQALGNLSSLAVPMLRNGRPSGAIFVGRTEVRPFSDREIALLQTFADQAVLAIQNAHLFQELQARTVELTAANAGLTEALAHQTATSEILRVIARSQEDVQPVFDAIAQSAARLCGAQFCGVFRFDGELLHLVAHHNLSAGGVAAWGAEFPMPASRNYATGRAILDRTVAQFPDVEADPVYGYRGVARAVGYRSIVGVPLLRDGKPVGALALSRVQAGLLPDKQVELLRTFADQAAIAMENVRLFQALRARTQALTRSVEELRALGEVGQAVSSTLDLKTVLLTIVLHAHQLSGTDGGAVYEYDEAAEVLQLRATQNMNEALHVLRLGEGAAGRAAARRAPVEIADILEDDSYQGRVRELSLRLGYRAILAVPLLREGRILGALAVVRKVPGTFPPTAIELLQTFAVQSALAIQNARLFREVEEKGRQIEIANRHKSEFLANMSHELRTPLNAIIGFSEVLHERMFGELNEKQAEYVRDIHSSGQHLLSLINNILDLSKIEAGRMELHPKRFNVSAALEIVLTLVREQAGSHGIGLELNVTPGLGEIDADELKFKQIMLNLLSNALKFTPSGGRITVSAGRAGDEVCIAVADTGVGIAPEHHESIFEEFRQAGGEPSGRREGTGLGLTLTRKFVELHGGTIRVDSVSGQGSTFTFTLPTTPRQFSSAALWRTN